MMINHEIKVYNDFDLKPCLFNSNSISIYIYHNIVEHPLLRELIVNFFDVIINIYNLV